MRELVGGKNTIGRTTAVLKKPHKATFNLFFKILGYAVNNILFKPPEPYQKKKVLLLCKCVSLILVIYSQNVFPLVTAYGITHKNISATEIVYVYN